MKVKHIKTLKDGRRHVLIEIGKAEPIPVAAISEDFFYRLNEPHDEVLQGHVLSNPTPVFWDSLRQAWSES